MILNGKVAIVTGSSMGIGEAIAKKFAVEGATVVVNSRSLKRIEPIVRQIEEAGGKAIAIAADVANKSEVDKMVAETQEKLGRLDIMVCNAGISMVAPSEELSEEDWRRTLDLNLSGAFFCCQAAAKVMIPQGEGGAIINISSILGETAWPKRAAYAVTKHGLNGLTKVLAAEWAKHKIRVLSLSPAYIATPMNDNDQALGDYTDEDVAGCTPIGRYGTAEEVANVALFLVSDAASYMTGSAVAVDGGWLNFGGWKSLL